MSKNKELLQLLGLDPNSQINRSEVQSTIVLATIDANYTSGLPELKFDGETSTSSKQYDYLSSYTPAANDRVLVVLFSHSGCILGKVI